MAGALPPRKRGLRPRGSTCGVGKEFCWDRSNGDGGSFGLSPDRLAQRPGTSAPVYFASTLSMPFSETEPLSSTGGAVELEST